MKMDKTRPALEHMFPGEARSKKDRRVGEGTRGEKKKERATNRQLPHYGSCCIAAKRARGRIGAPTVPPPRPRRASGKHRRVAAGAPPGHATVTIPVQDDSPRVRDAPGSQGRQGPPASPRNGAQAGRDRAPQAS